MSETFERDVIDRLARIETRLDSWESRLARLEDSNKNHSRNSFAGGSMGALIMAGVATVLKLLGWI